MKEDELRVAPSEVASAYSITDIAVPEGTQWEPGEQVKAAFDVFLLSRDLETTQLFRMGECGIVADMSNPEVQRLWEEFAGMYNQLQL